jgi:N-acetylglucosamine-6-phosphate deacetylase
MTSGNNKAEKVINCINCITGTTEKLFFREDTLVDLVETKNPEETDLFVGPGLIDLQINGINGIDFNNPAVSPGDIIKATRYLLSKGVTTFLPTVITNSDEHVCQILQAIDQACGSDRVVNDCIWGIHVEGPFISPAPGAKGAHDEKYIKAPDWTLVEKFQSTAGGRIKLITLAPEWDGACSFIRKCRENNIMVSIGHSMANSMDISEAIEAGATLSTHLGNGVPLQLPRHPNIIWDQLAAEELYACIITDGIHIPDSLIKVVTKTKGAKCLVVSDATCFAGMPPGEYENHIGGTVILDNEKRVSVKNSPGILAGAAKDLLENVETLLAHNLFKLNEAWQMASSNVAGMLAENDTGFDDEGDLVIFKVDGNSIRVINVVKKRRIVF